MEEKFTTFYNGVFSNWHPAKFVDENGIEFNNTEQYMMYHKALTFNDTQIANQIMFSNHPSTQKQLGRQVKGFVREKWDAISREVVYKGCFFKFNQNPKFKEELFETAGTTLVEASESDVIWGVGLHETDLNVHDRTKWNGKNWLGEVLTKLRDDMINDEVNFDVKHFN